MCTRKGCRISNDWILQAAYCGFGEQPGPLIRKGERKYADGEGGARWVGTDAAQADLQPGCSAGSNFEDGSKRQRECEFCRRGKRV